MAAVSHSEYAKMAGNGEEEDKKKKKKPNNGRDEALKRRLKKMGY